MASPGGTTAVQPSSASAATRYVPLDLNKLYAKHVAAYAANTPPLPKQNEPAFEGADILLTLVTIVIVGYLIKLWVACHAAYIEKVLLEHWPAWSQDWCFVRDGQPSRLRMTQEAVTGVAICFFCIFQLILYFDHSSPYAVLYAYAFAYIMIAESTGFLSLMCFCMYLSFASWLMAKTGWTSQCQQQQQAWQNIAANPTADQKSCVCSTCDLECLEVFMCPDCEHIFEPRSGPPSAMSMVHPEVAHSTRESDAAKVLPADMHEQRHGKQQTKSKSAAQRSPLQVHDSNASSMTTTPTAPANTSGSPSNGRVPVTPWWLRARDLGSSIFSDSTYTTASSDSFGNPTSGRHLSGAGASLSKADTSGPVVRRADTPRPSFT